MSDEQFGAVSNYEQETSTSGSIGGLVGQQAAWIAYNRGRQYGFTSVTGGIVDPGRGAGLRKGVYNARMLLGYQSTREEYRSWNAGLSFQGTPSKISRATRAVMRPVTAAQMLAHPNGFNARNVFRGFDQNRLARYGSNVVGDFAIDAERVGVYLTESMLQRGGKIATSGPAGKYNELLAKFAGVTGSKRIGQEATEVVAKKALTEVAESTGRILVTKGATKLALTVGNLWNPVGYALMAYDVAELSYYAFTGLAKVGEAYHYKIPKAYFQQSMKSFMRPRFAGIGPASAMTPDNMNNRMRAVQAIQGSKLNARSALGNEAGLLAGHFG
jgi:hypothetical protein